MKGFFLVCAVLLFVIFETASGSTTETVLTANVTNYCNNFKRVDLVVPQTTIGFDDDYYDAYLNGEYYGFYRYRPGRQVIILPNPGQYELRNRFRSEVTVSFTAPDCGSFYGPGNITLGNNFCNNYLRLVVSGVSTEQYYLYKDFQPFTPASSLEVFSLGQGTFYFPYGPGTYSFAIWLNNNETMSATHLPIVQYTITIPDCGSNYGPEGSLDATNYCSDLRKVRLYYANSPLNSYSVYLNYQPDNSSQTPILTGHFIETFTLPYAAGDYTFIIWRDINDRGQIPVVRLPFTTPDCGTSYPFTFSGDNYCSEGRVATLEGSLGQTYSISLNLYKNVWNASSFVSANIVQTFSGYTPGNQITLAYAPGSYSLVSWASNSDTEGKLPIVRQDFNIPDCGINYGSIEVSTTTYCNSLRQVTIVSTPQNSLYLFYSNFTSKSQFILTATTSFSNMYFPVPLYSGSFSIVVWPTSTEVPTQRATFTIPDCGEEYGALNVTAANNFCTTKQLRLTGQDRELNYGLINPTGEEVDSSIDLRDSTFAWQDRFGLGGGRFTFVVQQFTSGQNIIKLRRSFVLPACVSDTTTGNPTFTPSSSPTPTPTSTPAPSPTSSPSPSPSSSPSPSPSLPPTDPPRSTVTITIIFSVSVDEIASLNVTELTNAFAVMLGVDPSEISIRFALKRAVDVDITVQVNTTVNSTVTTSDLTQIIVAAMNETTSPLSIAIQNSGANVTSQATVEISPSSSSSTSSTTSSTTSSPISPSTTSPSDEESASGRTTVVGYFFVVAIVAAIYSL